MGILTWIVLGLVIGVLAKMMIPGKQEGGLIATTLLGIGGAVIGGFVASKLGYGSVTSFDIRTLGLAIGGSIVLVLMFSYFRG